MGVSVGECSVVTISKLTISQRSSLVKIVILNYGQVLLSRENLLELAWRFEAVIPRKWSEQPTTVLTSLQYIQMTKVTNRNRLGVTAK